MATRTKTIMDILKGDCLLPHPLWVGGDFLAGGYELAFVEGVSYVDIGAARI